MLKSHYNSKFNYVCTDCGTTYSGENTRYLCPSCNTRNTSEKPPLGVLKTVYDYTQIRKSNTLFADLERTRCLDLLPLNTADSLVALQQRYTPLYPFDKLDSVPLGHHLYIKDDSQHLTFSFKDRASLIVSAYAAEKGYDTIVAASTGNAGSSLAGICAARKQNAVIIVPEAAPVAKLTQIIMYGARIVPVKGTYDDAFDLSISATEEFGWYNRNTAYNPLTIEGKKTVSFEIFSQLNYQLPDRIFVPVGDGCIISGVYKGFEDLLELGFISSIPQIVMVQAEGSNNLIRNLESAEFVSVPSSTIADSISVDIPRNFYMTRQFIKKYKGEYLTVKDEEILNASFALAKQTGVFAEPASSAAFAGYLKYIENGKIESGSVNVVLQTGSGLKDIRAVTSGLNMPLPIEPKISHLKQMLV